MKIASGPIRDSPVSAHGAARNAIAMLVSLAATSAFTYAYAIALSWLLPIGEYGDVGVLQAVLLVTSSSAPRHFNRCDLRNPVGCSPPSLAPSGRRGSITHTSRAR